MEKTENIRNKNFKIYFFSLHSSLIKFLLFFLASFANGKILIFSRFMSSLRNYFLSLLGIYGYDNGRLYSSGSIALIFILIFLIDHEQSQIFFLVSSVLSENQFFIDFGSNFSRDFGKYASKSTILTILKETLKIT